MPTTQLVMKPRQLRDKLVGPVRPRVMEARHYRDFSQGIRSPRVLDDKTNSCESTRNRALATLLSSASSGASALVAENLLKATANATTEKMPRKRKLATRHEQCRVNQARYRRRKREFQIFLNEEVQRLHLELGILMQKHQDLASRTKNTQSPWEVVAKVVGFVETCFRSPWNVANAEKLKFLSETRSVLAFLHKAFMPDVAIGDLHGPDQLLEQLRRYALYFGDPSLQLQQVKMVCPGVMIATAALRLTVTDLTMKHVLPHLLNTKVHGKDIHMMDSEGASFYGCLLGQRLGCRFSMRFLFNDETTRVTRLETTVDLVNPLLQLLRSLGSVAAVLESALITPECALGDFVTATKSQRRKRAYFG